MLEELGVSVGLKRVCYSSACAIQYWELKDVPVCPAALPCEKA